MKTPTGGDRSVQWVIQYRRTDGDEIRVWQHAVTDGPVLNAQEAEQSLATLRAQEWQHPYEFRCIRVESVQRVEGW
jgi:hypothetical protein